MRLAKLTLSGFKSFAKTTTLEFPAAVSAIVGPNGSGKSNVAEATRWVLGEQSLKTLRGKRGEDLIFNGSASSPRMGKASVAMTFDNRDRAIAIDFNEVVLERKIFRDGTNEYYLNGSQVRLKDIVELIAKMGLGETKHNIIGQGEVDHILAASPRERREILEETIGLRLYQLKKREAERKLEETGRNIAQAEALLKEIRPHLRFLKIQADRAEKHALFRKELDDYFRAYIAKESQGIAAESARLEREAAPAAARLRALEKDLAEMSREVENTAKGEAGPENLNTKESELDRLENRRHDLERELGRIEGRLEAESRIRVEEPHQTRRVVEIAELEAAAANILELLRAAITLTEIAEIKKLISQAKVATESLLHRAQKPAASKAPEMSRTADLQTKQSHIQAELKELEKSLAALRQGLVREIQKVRAMQAGMRERWQKLRESEEEAGELRARLQETSFEKEKLSLRREELRHITAESGVGAGEAEKLTSLHASLETNEIKRRIEKLKVRLEEIGGIDESVLKEHHDTKTRYEFLEREMTDLKKAEKDLGGLVKELEARIESDFKNGFAKIKEEFQNYFRIIFGGGRGEMRYLAIRKTTTAEEESQNEESQETEYGIEIDVDLPRKRIKGLNMLSGGERALVSIALMFAVTAVNPPPFLVLDETDAALDEANSQKYAAILKELSKKTQLILITHNRETMTQAGLLYGVTMGEDGISKILSLKLEEAKSYGNR